MWPFSKKRKPTVEIEIPDGRGGLERKLVDKDEFDKLVSAGLAAGHVEEVKVATVNIIHPAKGIYQEIWTVGEGKTISVADFEKFENKGQLFVLAHLEHGEVHERLVAKELWDHAKKIMRV